MRHIQKTATLLAALLAAAASPLYAQTRHQALIDPPEPTPATTAPALRIVTPHPSAPATPATPTAHPAPHPTPAAPAAPIAPATPLTAITPSSPAPSGPVLPDFPKRPPASVTIPKQTRVNLAWQIALESADFSPGILDGHFKRKSSMALSEYAARYFPGTGPFDLRVFRSLNIDPDGAVTTYAITDDDAAQVGGTIPEDWEAKARLERLRYESLVDCIAEKFHCTRVLLETLNPGVKLDSLEPGQTINVPNLRPFPTDNKPTVVKRANDSASVTVNLAEKAIRVLDKEGREIALFHCSIAKDKAKLPDRDTAVKAIAAPNPNYTFDPRLWDLLDKYKQILTIPPGPRNPVGLAWVSLDLPGYGIHGSPKPELIGKTGSHGCFRLTNWDALKFAGLVREGMPVKIENPERNP